MIETGQAPTRAAVLELMNEQVVVKEAYVFLDEKRLLLASELLRQLKLYRELDDELAELHDKSREAMRAAVMHHGLDGLQVYAVAPLQAAELRHSAYNFMGVQLVDIELDTGADTAPQSRPVNPSGKAALCTELFRRILVSSAKQAGISGNLYRLLAEYRVTERRARALENVILPEIDQSLREMSSHLEELDLEDAVRVRMQSKQGIV